LDKGAKLMFCSILVLLTTFQAVKADDSIFLVTGATGRTGSLIYQQLVTAGFNTRALASSPQEAADVLNCTQCDASEGIYYGDVRNSTSLIPALQGVSFLAIAVGVGADSTEQEMQDVEWHGVENQVSVLASGAAASGRPVSSLGVALISSMGTTDPDPAPYEGGADLFWKLQAETFLASSAVPFAVLKPCGLVDGPGFASELLVGHDDYLISTQARLKNGTTAVDRTDVARVLVHALTSPKWIQAQLRIDLCSSSLQAPTTDLDALLTKAQWPWAR